MRMSLFSFYVFAFLSLRLRDCVSLFTLRISRLRVSFSMCVFFVLRFVVLIARLYLCRRMGIRAADSATFDSTLAGNKRQYAWRELVMRHELPASSCRNGA
jgi:hypothetical protein